MIKWFLTTKSANPHPNSLCSWPQCRHKIYGCSLKIVMQHRDLHDATHILDNHCLRYKDTIAASDDRSPPDAKCQSLILSDFHQLPSEQRQKG
jgi:hypothetical protein